MIFLANIFIFLANIIFIFSLFPQILLNYKLRSTKGLSDIFILLSLNSQFSYLIYSFMRNMPFIYKVINPVYAFLIGVIVFQRFYYSDRSLKDKNILRIYLLNIFAIFALFIFILMGYSSVLLLIGWVPAGIGLWKKAPQVWKVYKTKSVYGFSFFYIVLSLFSYFMETIANLILHLPAPVLFNDLRGFFINLIFLLQFWIYKKEDNFAKS